MAALGLFSAFLLFELVLLLKRSRANCGCFGGAYRTTLERAGVTSMAITVVLAVVHVWTAERSGSFDVARLAFFFLYAGFASWISLRMVQRHFLLQRSRPPDAQPPVG